MVTLVMGMRMKHVKQFDGQIDLLFLMLTRKDTLTIWKNCCEGASRRTDRGAQYHSGAGDPRYIEAITTIRTWKVCCWVPDGEGCP